MATLRIARLASARSALRAPAGRGISTAAEAYLEPTHPDLPPPAEVQSALVRHAQSTLNTYSRPSLIFTHGRGSYIYDTQNRPYLDFSSGIAVNALGHADPGVAKVMAEQAAKLVHCSNLYHNEWSGELAVLLTSLTKRHGGLGYAPGSPEEGEGLKVFFANSGTEANEGALKFARKHGKEVGGKGKTGLVAFRNAFHGRSMGALSVTPNPKYQDPFAPLIPDVHVGTLNDIDAIQSLVTEKTSGVIVEPVQGEGGIYEADENFLRALRKRCDEVGAVLIFDEIQCGLFRTTTMWAHSALPPDCHPDIVTMAKPLANGFPIGAILMRDPVASVINIGSHGTTFGGSPLSTRVAHHVLSQLSAPSFLPQLSASAAALQKRLRALREQYRALITSPIRGRGLILGIPLASADLPARAMQLARERGLLVLTAGSDVLRIVPSLNVTEEDIEKAGYVLEAVFDILEQERVGKEGKKPQGC